MDKDNIELAEEHIKLASELIVKEAQNADDDAKEKILDAGFSLEKAQAEVEELNGSDSDEKGIKKEECKKTDKNK